MSLSFIQAVLSINKIIFVLGIFFLFIILVKITYCVYNLNLQGKINYKESFNPILDSLILNKKEATSPLLILFMTILIGSYGKYIYNKKITSIIYCDTKLFKINIDNDRKIHLFEKTKIESNSKKVIISCGSEKINAKIVEKDEKILIYTKNIGLF